MKRRGFMTIGLGTVGVLGLGYGGSLAACTATDKLAWLPSLGVALLDMISPEPVARAYLAQHGIDTLFDELDQRQDLVGVALLPGSEARRARLRGIVQRDFIAGHTVVVDRWVVARTEALLAGALWDGQSWT